MSRIFVGAVAFGSIMAGVPAARPALAAPLNLSGTNRLRYEMIGGQARAGFDSKDGLFNVRTTLRADLAGDPIALTAELWDSRAYGADARTPLSTGEVNALEPVQLYATAKLGAVLGRGTSASVQAGRFLLNLGSRRLVAADDYRNTTNGYTGLRADLGLGHGWRSTLIYTLPQRRRPDDAAGLRDNRVTLDREGTALVLWGALVSKNAAVAGAMLEGGFFHLGERDTAGRPTRDRSLDTASVRLIREPAAGRLDFEAELIGQRGEIAASTAPGAGMLPVRAWFAHADMGYTLATPWKPRLSVDFDYASGDGRGRRWTRFDPLFGMRRADLAPGALYNAIIRSNLLSPGVRVEAGPRAGTDMMVSARPFWAASRTDAFSSTGVRDASGRSGRYAGSQIDARIRHRLSPVWAVELDGVLLAKGRLSRRAPNAPPGRWTRYLSLNLTAAFS